MSLAVDADSRATLSEVARLGPVGNVTILTCGDSTTAVRAAQELAAAWTPLEASADVRSLMPDGDRWTVAEISSIVAMGSRKPIHRNMVIIGHGDAMAGSASDQLLTVLEEPPAPTMFFVCTATTAALRTPLVGRAGRIIHLAPLTGDALVAAIAGDPADALVAESVALAGPSVSVAEQVRGHPELMEAVRGAFRSIWTDTPYDDSFAIVAALEKLCDSKAQMRELTRALLEQWRAQLRDELPVVDRSAMARHIGAASALDAAERDLAMYASPHTTLCATLVAANGSIGTGADT